MRQLIIIFCSILILFGCDGKQDIFSGKWDDLSGNHGQLTIEKVGKITYLISLGDNQWRAEIKDSILVYSAPFGEGYARLLDNGNSLELQGKYQKITKYQNQLITEKLAAEKERKRVELETKLAREREKIENSFKINILPESKDFTISNFEYLIHNFKLGKSFMITVLGEHLNGNKYTKKIIFATPPGEKKVIKLGFELRNEENKIFVENVIFGSAAEKGGIDFDQEIIKFQY